MDKVWIIRILIVIAFVGVHWLSYRIKKSRDRDRARHHLGGSSAPESGKTVISNEPLHPK